MVDQEQPDFTMSFCDLKLQETLKTLPFELTLVSNKKWRLEEVV